VSPQLDPIEGAFGPLEIAQGNSAPPCS